jgi:hypothetical protein
MSAHQRLRLFGPARTHGDSPGGHALRMAPTTQQGRFRRESGAAPDVQGGTASTAAVVVSADAVEHVIRHTSLRALGFVGMLAIALIHLLDVVGKIQETHTRASCTSR